MIDATIDKSEENEPAPPVEETDAPQFLVPVQAQTVSKRAKIARMLGNLLIVVGLLLLVGIGGWYGYTQWDNQRQLDEWAAKFGSASIDPSSQAVSNTPAPLPTIPALKPSNNLGGGIVGLGTNLLKVQDTSPPVRLVIPNVKIDSEIVPVTWKMIPAKNGRAKSEWQVADFAVGHHDGTPNPGEQGNVVLSGHVDYKGEVFKELHKVNKGDEVTVYTQNGQYIYVVTDLVIVKEEGVSEEKKRANAAYMNPTPDQTLTMITCWPYGIDDHRLIVIAKPYQSPISTQSEFVLR